MNRIEFFKILIDKLDPSIEVTENTNVLDIPEWDSLNVINVLSLFHEHFDKIISPSELNNCDTIGDILDLGIGYYE